MHLDIGKVRISIDRGKNRPLQSLPQFASRFIIRKSGAQPAKEDQNAVPGPAG